MKNLFILVCICICRISYSQSQFLTFDFGAALGNEASWPSSFNEPSTVLPSSISRGNGLTTAGNAGRFNSEGFLNSLTPVADDYLEFTVSANNGATVRISSIIIRSQRSGTGPQDFVIRTSLDNYTTNATNIISITGTAVSLNTFVFMNPIITTSSVVIRIYGYNATNNTGSGSWGPGEGAGNDLLVEGPGNSALPVSFNSLHSKQTNIGFQLEWIVFNESKLSHYDVQRSLNGIDFQKIGIVDALNRLERTTYCFQDLFNTNMTVFYRVLAIDLDGKISTSPVIKTGLIKSQRLKIFPNPVKGRNISLLTSSLNRGNYLIRISNAAGQPVFHSEGYHAGGIFSKGLLLPGNLQRGAYHISVIMDDRIISLPFVIQ